MSRHPPMKSISDDHVRSINEAVDSGAPSSTRRRSTKTWQQRAIEILEVASDAAEIFLTLRDRPRLLDYAALSVRAANLGTSIWQIVREEPPASMDAAWAQYVPAEERGLVLPYASSHFQLLAPFFVRQECLIRGIENDDANAIWRGRVAHPAGTFPAHLSVGVSTHFSWLRGAERDGPVAMKVAQQALWDRVGGQHAVLTSRVSNDGVPILDALTRESGDLPEGYVETAFGRETVDRLAHFSDAGVPRTFLLHGPPGTGKTSLFKSAISRFGLRSMRLSVDQTGGVSWSLSDLFGIVHLAHPDVLVVDDIDRVDPGWYVALLSNLESIRPYVRFVFASANSLEPLPAPLLRPERFDDVVEMPAMDDATLAALLTAEPATAPYKDRMRSWPIAFVRDFVQRVAVLGEHNAPAEFAALQARLGGPPRRTL